MSVTCVCVRVCVCVAVDKVMQWLCVCVAGQATEQERHFFTTELEVMKMLPAHPNVLQLVGSYTTNGQY